MTASDHRCQDTHKILASRGPSTHDPWVADQVRTKLPKLAALLDAAEADVLADMALPKEHRAKLHSTHPLERVNGEVKRRTPVVGIFPNEAAISLAGSAPAGN